jgi:putative inorganic carbon (HCO3(-)) transporter
MIAVSFYIYLTLSPFWYYVLTMTPAYIYLKTKILRMISIAGSTSFTGIYYAIVLALAFFFEPLQRTKLRRLWRGVFLFTVSACIVMTFNRGTWVGILVGLLVLVLQGQIDRRRVVVTAVLLAGLAALMTTSLFGQVDVEQQAVDFIHYSRSSAESRFVRWASAVNVVIEHPLLGVGYNNYAFVYGKYSILEGLRRLYGSPHNMYVDILTGTGFLGLTIFLTLLVRLWRQMQANLKAALPRDLALLSRGLFLAYLFFLGSGLFDSFLFKPHHSSYLVVAVWAMSTAVRRLRDQGEAPPASTTPPAATPNHGGKRP